MKHVYGLFGFEFSLELSTRPEKYLGNLETWNTAEEVNVDLISHLICSFIISFFSNSKTPSKNSTQESGNSTLEMALFMVPKLISPSEMPSNALSNVLRSNSTSSFLNGSISNIEAQMTLKAVQINHPADLLWFIVQFWVVWRGLLRSSLSISVASGMSPQYCVGLCTETDDIIDRPFWLSPRQVLVIPVAAIYVSVFANEFFITETHCPIARLCF